MEMEIDIKGFSVIGNCIISQPLIIITTEPTTGKTASVLN